MWGKSGVRERECGMRVGQERECVWGESGARERECVWAYIYKYHVLFHQEVVVKDENILYFGKVLISASKAKSIRSEVDLFFLM